MIKTLSDKIVALSISTIQVLMLGICTLFAVFTVDNSTASGENNPTANLPIISAGDDHTLAIIDGKLYAWGRNNYGQLGLGDTIDRKTPTRVGAETNWVSISAGEYYSLAINTAGELWSWGKNDFGQLGHGNTSNRMIPTRLGNKTNWIGISVGGHDSYGYFFGHSLAINELGELWAWGNNSSGQLGDGTQQDRNVPVRIGNEMNWISVSAGTSHSLAINNLGELWAWGDNTSGQLGDGTRTMRSFPVQIGTQTNWTSISAGEYHSLAINTDGALYAWGSNYYGQLGLGDSGTGTNQTVPTSVGTKTNWVSITVGGQSSFAINNLGELWAWGFNTSGQLGDGTKTLRNSPVKIGDQTNWITVSAGDDNSFGINELGELYAWGNNFFGQLGLGDTTARITPTELIIGSNVAAPNSTPNYTVSTPSATRVKIGGSFTFTITTNSGFSTPVARLNSINGKLALSSVIGNIYTYTISNVVGDIVANNFTISISRVQ